MRRINHVLTPSERLLGITLPTGVAPHLHRPLFALAASVALIVVLWLIQLTRLHAAQRDGEVHTRRLAAIEHDMERIRVLEREIVRLRALDEQITAIQDAGTARADVIATLGNELPRDVSLTSIRIDRGALAIEGHGDRLAAVAAAMAALARLPAFSSARLVTVHQDPIRRGVTYAIALEPTR